MLAALMVAGLVAGCEAPPQKADQNGYRGTGMVQITNAKKYEAKLDANKIPEPQPEADAGGRPHSSHGCEVIAAG